MNTRELGAKAEIALMGRVVYPQNNEEAEYMTDYIAKLLKGVSLTIEWARKSKYHPQIKALVVNKVHGMACITFAITTDEDKGREFNILDEDGCFCYVQNLESDWCSEYGY